MPMFTDQEILDFVNNSDSEEEALYELLILKSENTALSITGLTTAETSDYFKRLAATYRPNNTGWDREWREDAGMSDLGR